MTDFLKKKKHEKICVCVCVCKISFAGSISLKTLVYYPREMG